MKRVLFNLPVLLTLVLLTSCGSNPPQPPAPPVAVPSPPSMPSPPAMPSPSSSEQSNERPSEAGAPPSSTASSSSDNNEIQESREEIGQTLRESGDRIIRASRDLNIGNDDPLIPSGDSEASQQKQAGVDQASAGTPPPLKETAEQSLGSSNNLLEDEIRETQDALERAAVALQTTGSIVEATSSQEEASAAEVELTNARVAIIVAEQKLVELREILQDTDYSSDDIDMIVSASEAALEEANLAVVLASEIVGETLQMPTQKSGGDESQRGANGRLSELDKELEDSLIIFDGALGERKRILSDSTPAPVQARETSNSGIASEEGEAAEVNIASNDREVVGDEQSGLTLGQGDFGESSDTSENSITEDIPDAQGDDIVAKQLREAALAENDPAVKEKLWEEYRRYKTSL